MAIKFLSIIGAQLKINKLRNACGSAHVQFLSIQ